MNWPKKCIIALVLSLIMMPALYSIYFHVSQQLTRWEMHEKLEREASAVLVLHSRDIHWMEKNREILVNGLMFDIKSIEKTGDSLRITGEYDEEETELLAELKVIKESRDEEGNQTNAIHILILVMDDSIIGFSNTSLPATLPNPCWASLVSALPTGYFNTISPPPKS